MIHDDEQECVIYIRRNSDGVVREERNLGWFNDYIWREGNFSCDCNRFLFFQRAGNEDDSEDVPCSDGKYSIRIETADGEVYRDGYW